MALTLMKRLQMAGNKPIALIGGGTTMIGDPSGRTDMRKMLTKEDIAHNAACFKKQMEKFIDFSDGKALMLNNADWLLNLNYVELLRDVGACFSVNNMLRAKCYEQRMEKGLSFLEFNYMIMQSYDFYYMFQHYGCNMQFGGDDQWSNMLGGTELIRRKLGKDAYAMTITLLTDSQGKKMGKTAGNAVWLDPNKTSPFEFYQYWRNVGDSDVMKCIRMLTFLPLEQIDEMSTWKDQRLNEAKEILAFELTKMVHGEEEAAKAQNAARALFSGAAGDAEHMPNTQLTEADLTDGSIGILTLMVKAGLAASNGEARRLVVQGGVLVTARRSLLPRSASLLSSCPRASSSRRARSEAWQAIPFNDFYEKFYPTYFNLTSQSQEELYLSLAELYRIAVMLRVTDTYGPIPYSKVGVANAIKSPYDSQKEVYTKMFQDLDKVIEVLGKYAAQNF